MRKKQKWFLLNKESDFLEGVLENLVFEENALRPETPQKQGCFWTGVMDTGEKHTEWNKLVFICQGKKDLAVHLHFYTFEDKMVRTQGRELPVERLLHDMTMDSREKEEILKPYLKKEAELAGEVPLYEAVGRYGCLELIFAPRQSRDNGVFCIKALFPKDTWSEYLPELYRRDRKSLAFVEGYLGIFQSLHERMERQIQNVPADLNAGGAAAGYLQWLAEDWLSVQDSFLWKEKQLRYLTAHAVKWYKKRGTADYLREILRLYTGALPYIVEHHQFQFCRDKRERIDILNRLYGENNYVFTVIVDPLGAAEQIDIRILSRIIEREKPAWMDCNLVILEPYIFLGWHSYLGMNSILSDYHPLVLDGRSSIPFIRLTEQGDYAEGTGGLY